MRRTNGTQLRVDAPNKGLITRLPPDLQDDGKAQFLTAAENVRAEKGELQAAPGYERVHLPKNQLDSEANLIHQPNLISSDIEIERLPVIGTDGQLWTMKKRARELVCPAECSLRFAAVADSGTVYANTAGVAKLIRGWDPDLVVHAGDLVYPDGGTTELDSKYDTQVAKHYYWALGGYNGSYGKGPDVNKFLPALGNHDYDDGPLAEYLNFFALPGNERYYTVKQGPVQFFFVDSYGYGPSAAGPGGTTIGGTGADPGVGSSDLSSTGPQAQWLQAQLLASDCPWRVVVWHHPPQTSGVDYYPGYSVMNWPLGTWGADVLITGHSHLYERIHRSDGVLHIITGWGGKDLRNFVTTPVTGSMARYNTDYGAVRFDVSPTTMVVKAFTQAGIDIDTETRTTSRTFSVCYVPTQRQATRLEIRPSSVTLTRGVDFPFQAVATYLDGTVQDATELSDWASLNSGIVTVTQKGIAQGQNTGTATIQATYQGITASAEVVVPLDCSEAGREIALVLDTSGSMVYTNPPNGPRIDRLKQAVNLFLDTCKPDDRVLTVSFSSDADLYHGLTSDLSKAREAVSGFQASGATYIAAGVDLAQQTLESSALPGKQRLMLVFTDGLAYQNFPECTVGATRLECMANKTSESFTAAKLAGTTVILVVLDLDILLASTYPGLPFDPETLRSIIYSWPNCPTVLYSVEGADNLLPTFVKLRNEVCVGLCSSGSGVGTSLI
jgi:Mg-chelatase subunit ChlD/predicted phosphodiesterase